MKYLNGPSQHISWSYCHAQNSPNLSLAQESTNLDYTTQGKLISFRIKLKRKILNSTQIRNTTLEETSNIAILEANTLDNTILAERILYRYVAPYLLALHSMLLGQCGPSWTDQDTTWNCCVIVSINLQGGEPNIKPLDYICSWIFLLSIVSIGSCLSGTYHPNVFLCFYYLQMQRVEHKCCWNWLPLFRIYFDKCPL